jgi:hypothetical protein
MDEIPCSSCVGDRRQDRRRTFRQSWIVATLVQYARPSERSFCMAMVIFRWVDVLGSIRCDSTWTVD